MTAPFTASIPGLPCCKCGRNVKVGAQVFYPSGWITDDDRHCADCAPAVIAS